jgi:hypothetical protein
MSLSAEHCGNIGGQVKAEISFKADGSPYIEFSELSHAERHLVMHTRVRLGLSPVWDDGACYLNSSNSNAAADAEVASWTAR